MLMNGLPINFGAMLRDNMRLSRDNCNWKVLEGKMIDVTKVKEPNTTFVSSLTPTECHSRDDSKRGHMFWMFDLQLQIGGILATPMEMSALEDQYSLIDSAMMMFKVGLIFEELLDVDKPILLTDAID
ncbi:hypothetical protein HAX54_028312 [Datura stramonium]|uniref:Uncharacterized protein n=1 Tax=Datura stramonium TaxID=4076 RepID=A0ABS8V3Y5_DATST|nr:hypothetical protein [Datura stramonium]